jgi:hypothetical protein
MADPQVAPLTERRHAGGYIVWQPDDGQMTNKQIVLSSAIAAIVGAGLVLGQITIGARTAVGAAGNPAPAGATISAAPVCTLAAKVGVHSFVCVTAGATGKFRHIDPQGEIVGVATTGTPYTGGGMTLTITDSGTDPALGETFTVTVTAAAASGKWVPYDPTALNGAQTAAGILWSEYSDCTLADQAATATVRGPCKVNRNELIWGANVTTTQHKTDAYAALDLLGVQSV